MKNLINRRKTPSKSGLRNAFQALINTGLVLAICIVLLATAGRAEEKEGIGSLGNGLANMSLDDLMRQSSGLHRDTVAASGVNEAIRDVPTAMVVVDSQTIRRRGYDSVDDLLHSLPGFDTITTNGTMQTISYQRGYRTPWTQRTLFLVNGKVDNNLWNHSAQMSRQYPMAIIDRVEVLNGPAGAVYGPNAFLGVINLVTRDSSKLSEGEHHAEANFLKGSFESSGVDIALGGREGAFSYDLGLKIYESDEPGIEDYSDWAFTDESLLADPTLWGPGIGEGVDPTTGRASPAGDIDVDGEVEDEELFRGSALGEYRDPTTNYGVVGEARLSNWELGVIKWKTNEGYGPYYSFADAQPGVSWEHESSQLYLSNESEFLDSMDVSTEFVYRNSRVGGDWIESSGDSASISTWNSYSEAWRFEQDYSLILSSEFSISGGVKIEHRDLAKLYEICNYIDGFGICMDQGANSIDGMSSDGSGVIPIELISSDNPTPLPPALNKKRTPDSNISHQKDYGGYLQGIWDIGDWRLNSSLRCDDNSEYGSVLIPRVAIVRHNSSQLSYKLVYGEAFQEPSPKDLFGGWSGRQSNPNLMPEKAQNLEFMITCQSDYMLHDASFFVTSYNYVIAGGQNVEGRSVYGFEYKGSYRIRNFLENSSDITGTLYYTYTDSQSEMQYNNSLGEWEARIAETGDIAPHKINFSVNVPVKRNWNANVVANWVSERALFSQNPLRADSNPNRSLNRKAESYLRVDANFLYETERYRMGFKIENLFEEEYLLPGAESASSGDDFSRDFDGFQNSLIPQVKERVYTLMFTFKI